MNILKYNVCYSYFCLHPLLIHFWLLIRFKYNALFLSLAVYRSMNRRNDGSVLVLRYPPCRPKETWLNAWKLTSYSLLTGLHTSGTLDHNSVSLSFVTSAIDCLLINSLSSIVLRGNSNHKSLVYPALLLLTKTAVYCLSASIDRSLHSPGFIWDLQPAPCWMFSVQFSSVTQSCLTLCNPMNCSAPGLPVHHQLLESTQTHVHRVGDAIQPSHPLSSPSPPAPNPSQHQGPFQWDSSSHQVAKVLEFQFQHQSFQWTPRTDLL